MIFSFHCEERYNILSTLQQSELLFQSYFWGMDDGQTKPLLEESSICKGSPLEPSWDREKSPGYTAHPGPFHHISFIAVTTHVLPAITDLAVWESLPMILGECSLSISFFPGFPELPSRQEM